MVWTGVEGWGDGRRGKVFKKIMYVNTPLQEIHFNPSVIMRKNQRSPDTWLVLKMVTGKTEKLSKTRGDWGNNNSRRCGSLDWIQEEKEGINGDTGEIQLKTGLCLFVKY